MVNVKSTNFVNQSRDVQTRVRDIAVELDNQSPKTNKKFHLLTQKLDATLEIFNTIKEQLVASVFSKIATEALEKEIVSLYGRIVDAWVENEINQIQHQATNIANALFPGGKVTAKSIQKLALQLESFKKDHRPSIQQRRVIAEAEHIMVRAHAFLKGDYLQKPPEQAIHAEEGNDLNALEAEELMDIASSIYNSDPRQAKMKYLQLSEEYKKGFLRHMQLLNATPFVDSFQSIQALIALANELVRNGDSYPTREQIDEFFLDLAQVNLEESADPDKAFSFRSRKSLGR